MRQPVPDLRLGVLGVLACISLVGCATPPAPPAPRTTVILLPDADGQIGAVEVGTAEGSRRLDRAYTAATAQASTAPTLHEMGRDRVISVYADLLQAQPPAPATFVLTFLLDKTTLTESSKALLPAIFAELRARKPTEIAVSGHADASGTGERNFQLSAERARFVADLLRKQEPSLARIDIQAFGHAMPLVPTESRAPEPRNRRAEIVIF